jgi:15-cis-phytoene synthase
LTSTVDEALQVCEAITREQARNFFYGIRLLPATKRSGLCALYALSRRIDDIGDGDLPTEAKAAALGRLRADLAHAEASTDPVLIGVAATAERFPVPMGAFGELIDGVEMDVRGRTYETFDELVEYCRCVAGAVGRLCLGVFGAKPMHSADGSASDFADALGIALQQTNILRDIREDLGNGRIYLPQQDLDRFDVELKLDGNGNLVDIDGRLAQLIEFAATRNRAWYARGWRLMPLLDRRSAACTGAMSGIYRRLLDDIAARPTAVYDRRLSLSGWQKAAVAARALTGMSR